MQSSNLKGYFTVFVGKDDQYYFNLKAGNHEIILQSEGYESKSNALKGIRSVQVNCPSDSRYKRKVAKNKQPYFTLIAGNGKTIGKSEEYSSVQKMEQGIESVMRNGLSKVIKGCEDESIVIKVNKTPFTVSANSLSGSDILELAGLAPSKYSLFLQEDGKQVEIQSNGSVALVDGMCFQAIVSDIKFG